ncbi:ROK family transcriptional regulator [Streptomyces sp. NPDC049577]|uniref:ROK family transcriptional regulator n=1 Tax=Streptomyces sp. NPDC049577 TaxID=3155153 RepID=UPI003415E94B
METKNPGANLAALRDHNAAVVLGLLRDAGEHGLSRAELAAGTGLTPQAVSKIAARLRDAGFAAEAGRRASTGGKPAVALRLVRDAAHAVGVALDRDAMTVTVVDLAGTAVATRTAPLDLGAGAEAVLSAVTAEVRALPSAGGRVLGVGVTAPGPLDHARGVLGRVTGFPEWEGFPLRDALAARLRAAGGEPGLVVLDKDTNAAALRLAAPAPRTGGSFAYLHLGSGLGAGLVLDGAVHRGARTNAGEFGHQVVQLDGPPCACGNRGCVEVLCLRAVAEGDTARAARLLGVAAGNLVRLLDVDHLVLGGRTVLADPEAYAAGVREGTGAAVPVEVTPAGERTVVEGAAELVLARLFRRPGAGLATRADDRTIPISSGN